MKRAGMIFLMAGTLAFACGGWSQTPAKNTPPTRAKALAPAPKPAKRSCAPRLVVVIVVDQNARRLHRAISKANGPEGRLQAVTGTGRLV